MAPSPPGRRRGGRLPLAPGGLPVRAEIVERLRGAMRERGLDALVACSPENVAYLAGLVVPSQPLMRWRHAFCIVPLDGPTAMVVVDMEEHTVRSRVPGPRYYVWREFAGDCMAVVAEALRDLGLADARLGLELDYLRRATTRRSASGSRPPAWRPPRGCSPASARSRRPARWTCCAA